MAAVWAPDSSASNCGACKKAFTLVLRKHHCRVCGQIFCDDCTSRRLILPQNMILRRPGSVPTASELMFPQKKPTRVCLTCWGVHKDGLKVEAMPVAPTAFQNLPLSQPQPSSNFFQQPAQLTQLASQASYQNQQPQQMQPNPYQQNPYVAAPTISPSQPQAQQPYQQPQALPQAQDMPSSSSANFVPAPSQVEGFIVGPPPPANSAPLPTFPGPNAVQSGNLFGMLQMGLSMASAAKSHRNDPHLSAEENAIRQAQGIQSAGGITSQQDQLISALKILEASHMPQGLVGFVLTSSPAPGTLGQQFGLQAYDFIYAYENTLISPDMTSAQFTKEMHQAFQATGRFIISVYSFKSRTYRPIIVFMPPGKPTAILGISCSQLPYQQEKAAGITQELSSDMYVKAWRKQGGMYISSGNNAVPLFDPLTSENQDLYTKVFRNVNGMWISTNEYHPIYNYSTLSEPLYVEVWRYKSGMLIRNSGEYAPLPMDRSAVA